jgi:ABC-type oligopeptide transport system ATPase subunit
MAKVSPLIVTGVQSVEANFAQSAIAKPTNVSNPNEKKIRINLIGITGSGKSTVAQKISDFVSQKGGKCLIVSSDKRKKKGRTGKEQANLINKEIRGLNNTYNCNLKVVVVDICNESGATPICFGYDLSAYTTFDFFPNLEKAMFDDYECWCLNNVLSRSMHSEQTNYWLNPESAGVQTCIKVHNAKASKFKQYLKLGTSKMFSEYGSMQQIKDLIKDGQERYANHLAKTNLDEIVRDFTVKAIS